MTYLQELATKSPGFILAVLGLYLFKVIVNDVRHDVEAARRHMATVEMTLTRIADAIDRVERKLEGR